MVVSAESQKIYRKHPSSRGEGISSMSVRRTTVPLFLMPFIAALLFFSFILSFIEVLWQSHEPNFRIDQIVLPDERDIIPLENQLLKASAPDYFRPSEIETEEKIEGVRISEYRLREGDRFSILAKKYNLTLDTLVSVNELTASSEAMEGLVIKIPDQSGIIHSVEKNETLSSISALYGVDIESIQDANNLLSSVIRIDQRLFIPGGELSEEERERVIGRRFVIPAEGTVKDNYGPYLDPLTGLKNYNYGIDIVNRKGTAVYAARSGVVGNTSYNSYYGRVVQVNHSGSIQTLYSCLDSILVKPGDTVERGDLLGYMGNSGFRAGEHLQFSIFKNKEDVDTLEFIF